LWVCWVQVYSFGQKLTVYLDNRIVYALIGLSFICSTHTHTHTHTHMPHISHLL
jgi:hypothetical protein